MYTFLHNINWKELEVEISELKVFSKKTLLFKKRLGLFHDRFLFTIFDILSSMPLQQVDGKYNASSIFNNMPDVIKTPYYNFSKDEFRDYFLFLVKVPPSVWLIGTQTKPQNTKYSRLVPLVLAAYKDKKGIPYESWDFTDPMLKYFMNKGLFECVSFRHLDFSSIDVSLLREHLTNPVDKYPTAKKVDILGLSLPMTHPAVVSLTQVWLANVKYRTNLMVLDLNDWDNMPKAIDSTVEEIIKPTTVDYLEAPF